MAGDLTRGERGKDGNWTERPGAVTRGFDSRLVHMTFDQVLPALRSGNKIAREGWNGKGMWLKLQVPDRNSKMTLPYIYMSTVTGDLVPWVASQTDILADDWSVL